MNSPRSPESSSVTPVKMSPQRSATDHRKKRTRSLAFETLGDRRMFDASGLMQIDVNEPAAQFSTTPIDGASQDLATLQAEVFALEKGIEEAATSFDETQSLLTLSSQRLRELETRHEQLTLSLSSLRDENDTERVALAPLSAQLQELRVQEPSLQARLDRAFEELSAARDFHTSREKRFHNALTQLEKASAAAERFLSSYDLGEVKYPTFSADAHPAFVHGVRQTYELITFMNSRPKGPVLRTASALAYDLALKSYRFSQPHTELREAERLLSEATSAHDEAGKPLAIFDELAVEVAKRESIIEANDGRIVETEEELRSVQRDAAQEATRNVTLETQRNMIAFERMTFNQRLNDVIDEIARAQLLAERSPISSHFEGTESTHPLSVDPSVIPEVPVEHIQRFTAYEGTSQNYASHNFDALGTTTVYTGGTKGIKIKDGILQGGYTGDAVVLKLDAPVHIKEMTIEHLEGYAHTQVHLRLFKNDQLVFETRFGGSMRLPVDIEADTINLTPQMNTHYGISEIVTILSPEEQAARQLTALRETNDTQFDMRNILAFVLPDQIIRDYQEHLPAKGEYPSSLPSAGSFTGATNAAINEDLSRTLTSLMTTLNPTIAPPTEQDIVARIYERMPYYKPENWEAHLAHLRAVHGHHSFQIESFQQIHTRYVREGLYNYEQDLYRLSRTAVDYVLASFDHDEARMTQLRSSLAPPNTVLTQLGYQFPSTNALILAAYDLIHDHTLWYEVEEIVGWQHRMAHDEQVRQFISPSHAGSGGSSSTAPDLTSLLHNRSIVAAQWGEGSAQVLAFDQAHGTGTIDVTMVAQPGMTDVDVGGVSFDESGDTTQFWASLREQASRETADVHLLELQRLAFRPEGQVVTSFGGQSIRVDTEAGRILAGIAPLLRSYRTTPWSLGRLSTRVEEVFGIDAVRIFTLARTETDTRFEQGIISLFAQAGYDVATAPSTDRTLPVGVLYHGESVRIAINPSGFKTVSHVWINVTANGVTEEDVVPWEKGARFTDIPASVFRGMNNPTIKVIAWFEGEGNETTLFTYKEVDVSRLAVQQETTNGHTGQAEQLPEANKLIIDYLENVIKPTLIKVSETEWVSPDSGLGGECKVWIQKDLMANVFGVGHPIIPSNNSNDLSTWNVNDISDVVQIAQWNHLGSSGESISDFFEDLSQGDIVQANISSGNEAPSPHTFVVQQVSSNGVWVYDSNWSRDFDGTVRYHFFSFSSLASWTAITGYRIKS